MNWWGRLLRKKQIEQELGAELEFHLAFQISDNMRAGMSEEEARRAACAKFGGLEQVKEDCRDVRATSLLESTARDMGFALRTLCKSPGFTTTAILTLALGIGANTAIFQLLDAVRLRSLPIAHPETLVNVEIDGGNQGFGVNRGDGLLSYPLWEQIRLEQRALARVFAWASEPFRLGRGAQRKQGQGLFLSGDTFPTLGIVPAAGRLTTSEDDHPGCQPVAVIRYRLWQSEFAGQNSAVDSKLVIEDHPVEVIGITPPSFFGLEVGKTFDVAAPFCVFSPDDESLTRTDAF